MRLFHTSRVNGKDARNTTEGIEAVHQADFQNSVDQLTEAIKDCIASHFAARGIAFDPSKIPDYYQCIIDKAYDTHFYGAGVFPKDTDLDSAA